MFVECKNVAVFVISGLVKYVICILVGHSNTNYCFAAHSSDHISCLSG